LKFRRFKGVEPTFSFLIGASSATNQSQSIGVRAIQQAIVLDFAANVKRLERLRAGQDVRSTGRALILLGFHDFVRRAGTMSWNLNASARVTLGAAEGFADPMPISAHWGGRHDPDIVSRAV
jgi:hypothetical protein